MFDDGCDSSFVMKGFFLAAAAAVAVFAILIIAAPCADAESDHHGTFGDITYDFDGDSGAMYLSGEGAMRDTTPPWYWYKSAIKSVNIGGGVTYIPDFAFSGCNNLVTVTVGKNVQYLGNCTFNECHKLRVINYNAIDIGGTYYSSPFTECGPKEGITLNIGDEVKGFPKELFSYYYSSMYIKEINFGNQLDTIGDYAFAGAFINSYLEIPDSIKSIGSKAFSSCPYLRILDLGRGVELIGEGAFALCPKLEIIDKGLGVTQIGDSAFASCLNLRDMCPLKNVERIGKDAFHSCINLKWMQFESKLAEIGDSAFEDCRSLKNVIFFRNESFSIGDRAFFGCGKLTELDIRGNGSFSIGSYAFAKCYMRYVTLDVTGSLSIGDHGFDGCRLLTYLSLYGGNYSIGDHCFSGCVSLSQVTFPHSGEVGSYAFLNCTELRDLKIVGAGPYIIGDHCFCGCTVIRDLKIAMTESFSIGSYAFAGCAKLLSLNISGTGLLSIGDYGFSECTGIYKLSLPESGNCSIGDHGFYRCTSLTGIEFPADGIHEIGSYAFADCASLRTVICLNATSIGDHAFRSTALTVANLPDGLTYLGRGAYENCVSLTDVIVNTELKKIFGGTFEGCPISIIGFWPGTEPISMEAHAFQDYLIDKEGTPFYDPYYKYNNVTVRGRYFEPIPSVYGQLRDYETHEWGGDEPIPPVKPVKPAMEETEKGLVLSEDQTYMMLSDADVQAVKDAGANGKTVKIQLSGGTITLDPKSAANIAYGIQTAAIGPADTSSISPELKKRIGDHPVLDIRVGENHRFSGTVTVSIDYQLKDGEKADDLVVWHLNDNGTYETYDCTYEDGKLTFVTDHMSNFAVVHSDVSYVTVYAAAGVIALMAVAILVLGRVKRP